MRPPRIAESRPCDMYGRRPFGRKRRFAELASLQIGAGRAERAIVSRGMRARRGSEAATDARCVARPVAPSRVRKVAGEELKGGSDNDRTALMELEAEITAALRVLATSNADPARPFADLLKGGDKTAVRLLQLRQQCLTDEDRAFAARYRESGDYADLTGDERASAFACDVELAETIGALPLDARFALYEQSHPLFARLPQLWPPDKKDLLRDRVDFDILADGTFEVDHLWCRLEPMLDAEILSWVRATYPRAATYIRVDPLIAQTEVPSGDLHEAVLRSANPKWWGTLNIWRGKAEGASYTLDPQMNSQQQQSTTDYWIKGLRSLQVHAHRPKDEYLSMSIEELQDKRSRDGSLVGRMIHLDTKAVAGTSVVNAVAEHIDLAINVYRGVVASSRIATDLANGKIPNASARTHLLRIDSVPLVVLLALAERFFLSAQLRDEWMAQQFA